MTLRPQIKDQKPEQETEMPSADHYADLIASHGKDNDYEQLALDATVFAADRSDDNDRLVASNAALTFALLHLARTAAAQKPAAYTIRSPGPGQWTARPDLA